VNCRPLNDLHKATPDKYDKGDGPEYVTLGKFGTEPRHRQRRVGDSPQQHLQRSRPRYRIDRIGAGVGVRAVSARHHHDADTGGIELVWGEAATIERLLFMTAAREGFGSVLADSTRAVERGTIRLRR
jgi:aldehyde:ferredoxin oxidoreductase